MASGSNIHRFKPPPEGYELDNLIVEFSKKISQRELETLKQRFSSIRVIKDVKTPKEMLNSLKDQEFIGRYNILYIQQMCQVLGREDLLDLLNRYVEMFEEDNVLHFNKTSTKTAEGYTIVQFHILGHGPLERKDLEYLRKEVSRLLLCPLHEVIVKGIQETHSTLMTFMIPTMYVDFLMKQLEKHNKRIIKSLIERKVDKVIFGKDEYVLLEEGDTYKVKKSNSETGPVKHVKVEYSTSKASGEKQQTPKRRSPIDKKSQQRHGTKRSSPENESSKKKICRDVGTGIKKPRQENGILTRSTSPSSKFSKLCVPPVI